MDNLGPATPTFLAARREGDATFLRWLPNTEADLAGYRLYRGSDGGFTPAPANLVAAPADTGYLDAGARLFAWYKLMAVDVHGNESPVATRTWRVWSLSVLRHHCAATASTSSGTPIAEAQIIRKSTAALCPANPLIACVSAASSSYIVSS